MADKKISALTGAATPLAGSEVLPIVQSGATVKVSVDNLTAGKTVNASGLQIGSIGATSAAFPGRIKLEDGPVSLQGPGGLEFVTATFGSGYGWKISSIDSAGAQLLFGYRQNSVDWTESMRLTSDGNLKISTAAKGIDFSANTHAAGMTSELLTWYEEGVWTPTFSGTVSGTLTATGTYTRVGRLVYWVANLVSTGSTSATQDVGVIQGFPFVIGSGKLGTCSIVNRSNTSTVGLGQVAVSSGSTTVYTCGWTTLSNVLLSGVFEV
jgi:hypothetical protein